MRKLEAELLAGDALYREVVLDRICHARESVRIATANVKEMWVEEDGKWKSLLSVFSRLARKGVDLRLLHAETPSRPFRAGFDKRPGLVGGGLALRICPRVHLKTVIVDGAWAYLGSANLTGAGLGAKGEHKRNFELGFVTEDFDTIDRVTAMFEAIWNGDECPPCQRRDVCPDPQGEPAASKSKLVKLGKTRRIRTGSGPVRR